MSNKSTNFRILLPIFLILGAIWAVELSADVTQIPDSDIKDRINTSYEFKLPTKYGTAHFKFHFNKGHVDFVARSEEILRQTFYKVVDYFQFVPDAPINIIVNGAVFQSNGSATVFPQLVINLFDYPPMGIEHLNTSGDWLQNLIVHEIIHVIHLAQINGVNKVINFLTGAGRLMPMITPRWFTEGIAVWGETKLTEQGRLRNSLFSFETKKALLHPDSCRAVGCLTNPGIYPFRQFPYWVGAFFLDSLEAEKPGTIKCLVEANSRKIPYFLNWSFRDCIGKNAEQKFQEFITDYIDRSIKDVKNFKIPGVFADYKAMDFGKDQIAYQSGMSVIGENLYLKQIGQRVSKLRKINLNDGSSEIIDTEKVLRSFYDYDNKLVLASIPYRDDIPLDYSFLKEGKTEEEIKTHKSYLYYFESEGMRLGLGYKHGRWRLYKEVEAEKKKDRAKLIYTFPYSWQLYQPFKTQYGVRFLAFDSKTQRYSFHEFNFKKERPFALFEFKGTVQDFFSCEKKVYVRIDRELFELRENSGLRHKPSWLDEVAFMRYGKSHGVVAFKKLPVDLYYSKGGCNELSLLIKNKASKKVSYQKQKEVETASPKTAQNTLTDKVSKESSTYSPLGLQRFNYWLLNGSFDENLQNLSFDTNLSDPGQRLSFNLGARQYFELEETGYNVGTAWNFMSKWYLGLNTSKGYGYSGFADFISSYESHSAYVRWRKSFGRFEYIPTVGYSEGDSSDFISNRKSKNYSLTQTLAMKPRKYDDFWHQFSFRTVTTRQETLGRSNFFSDEYFVNFIWKYNHNLKQSFSLTYGKNHKKDLGSGAIFGGRMGSHNVLGIAAQDLFGNEIYTLRTQFDLKIAHLYKSATLFPLGTQEIFILAGVERFKSDFVYIDDTLWGKNELNSYHGGVRFKMLASYFINIDVDLLYVVTEKPSGDDFGEYVPTIQMSYWP
ncbi:MAG: hypothetical protein ACPGJV_06065 [Bacteriovoracaceae bacterium]